MNGRTLGISQRDDEMMLPPSEVPVQDTFQRGVSLLTTALPVGGSDAIVPLTSGDGADLQRLQGLAQVMFHDTVGNS